MTPDAAVQHLEARRPEAFKLARLLAFAVRADPVLIRRARLQFLPWTDAGIEADLWFHPVVESQSAAGIVLHGDAADVLRRHLAAFDPALYEDAWQLTRTLHAHLSPLILLEEEVSYLLESRNPAAEATVRERFRSAVAALVAPGGDELAPWAARALPRFPAKVRSLEPARMLALGARYRLGHSVTSSEDIGRGTNAPWAEAVRPEDWNLVEVGLRRFADHLEVVDADRVTAERRIAVPRTDPLVIELATALPRQGRRDESTAAVSSFVDRLSAATTSGTASAVQAALEGIQGVTESLRGEVEAPPDYATLPFQPLRFRAGTAVRVDAPGRWVWVRTLLGDVYRIDAPGEARLGPADRIIELLATSLHLEEAERVASQFVEYGIGGESIRNAWIRLLIDLGQFGRAASLIAEALAHDATERPRADRSDVRMLRAEALTRLLAAPSGVSHDGLSRAARIAIDDYRTNASETGQPLWQAFEASVVALARAADVSVREGADPERWAVEYLATKLNQPPGRPDLLPMAVAHLLRADPERVSSLVPDLLEALRDNPYAVANTSRRLADVDAAMGNGESSVDRLILGAASEHGLDAGRLETWIRRWREYPIDERDFAPILAMSASESDLSPLARWRTLIPEPPALETRYTHHVYLSAAAGDDEWTVQLYDVLRDVGYEVFWPRVAIEAGTDVRAAMERGLEGAASALVVWSPASGESEWQNRELDWLVKRQSEDPAFRVVPVTRAGRDLPNHLRSWQWLPMTKPASGPGGDSLVTLLFALRGEAPSPEAQALGRALVDEQRDGLDAVRAAADAGDADRLARLPDEGLAWQATPSLFIDVIAALRRTPSSELAVDVVNRALSRFPHSIRLRQLRDEISQLASRSQTLPLVAVYFDLRDEAPPRHVEAVLRTNGFGVDARHWRDAREKGDPSLVAFMPVAGMQHHDDDGEAARVVQALLERAHPPILIDLHAGPLQARGITWAAAQGRMMLMLSQPFVKAIVFANLRIDDGFGEIDSVPGEIRERLLRHMETEAGDADRTVGIYQAESGGAQVFREVCDQLRLRTRVLGGGTPMPPHQVVPPVPRALPRFLSEAGGPEGTPASDPSTQSLLWLLADGLQQSLSHLTLIVLHSGPLSAAARRLLAIVEDWQQTVVAIDMLEAGATHTETEQRQPRAGKEKAPQRTSPPRAAVSRQTKLPRKGPAKKR